MIFSNRFKVLGNEYVNNGGGCMVEKVTVYDLQVKRTIWICVSLDGCSVSTLDWLNYTLDGDDTEESVQEVICGFDEEAPGDYNILFEHCKQLFLMDDYKKTQHCMYLEYNWLPFALRLQVNEGVLEWYETNGQKFKTNGRSVLFDQRCINYLMNKH